MQTSLNYLRQYQEVALATSADGLPHIRVFQVMRQEGARLFFATSSQKAVWHELQANPHLEVLARDGQVSVRAVGKACFDVPEEICQWIYDHNPVLPRLYSSASKLSYFYFDIATLDYFNLEPTPPILRHFDLVAGTESGGFVGERFSKE